MNSHQEDKYGMYLKTDLYLVTYVLELAFNPAIAAARTVLNTFINAIAQADSTATRDLTGFTEAKQEQRDQQVALFKKVRAGMMCYFIANPDPGKEGIVNYSDTTIEQFRDAELYIKTDQLLDLALPVKTLLVSCGVADTDVDALDTFNQAWPAIEPGSRFQEGVNKAARKDVAQLMEDTDKHLAKPLDIYMKVVQYNNPNLYDQYLTARMIDDSGGNSGSEGYNVITITIPGGGSIIVPMGPDPISPEQEVYLRVVTQGGGVMVCTTAQPASPCTAGYEQVSGVTFKGPISEMNLDLNLPDVQITNPGLSTVVVRVGVKEEE